MAQRLRQQGKRPRVFHAAPLCRELLSQSHNLAAHSRQITQCGQANLSPPQIPIIDVGLPDQHQVLGPVKGPEGIRRYIRVLYRPQPPTDHQPHSNANGHERNPYQGQVPTGALLPSPTRTHGTSSAGAR